MKDVVHRQFPVNSGLMGRRSPCLHGRDPVVEEGKPSKLSDGTQQGFTRTPVGISCLRIFSVPHPSTCIQFSSLEVRISEFLIQSELGHTVDCTPTPTVCRP